MVLYVIAAILGILIGIDIYAHRRIRTMGTMIVDDTGPKIVCRIALDDDPTEYRSGQIVKIRIKKEKAPKGIDINAD